MSKFRMAATWSTTRLLHFSICILQFAIYNLAVITLASGQTVIHVNPLGDDGAAGSAAHPLKTLHGAQRHMRERFAAGTPRWVRVEIAPGRYVLDVPLVLSPADSGESREHAVTYAAFGGQATLTGGQRIT